MCCIPYIVQQIYISKLLALNKKYFFVWYKSGFLLVCNYDRQLEPGPLEGFAVVLIIKKCRLSSLIFKTSFHQKFKKKRIISALIFIFLGPLAVELSGRRSPCHQGVACSLTAENFFSASIYICEVVM